MRIHHVRARKILLVDDSDKFRTSVRNALGADWLVTEAASETEFKNVFRPYTFDLVILDMRLEHDREGLKLLRRILGYDEFQPVIMVSAYGDTDAVLDAAEGGALMFLHKQEFTPELLARMAEAVLQQARVRRHVAALQSRLPSDSPLEMTSGNSAVRRAANVVQRAADDGDCAVLVVGEYGTGHELAAQAIHDRSPKRAIAPLIVANGRTSFIDNFDTVLFGHNRQNGLPRSKGLLEQANGGVFFIDGLDVLPKKMQNTLGLALHQRVIGDATGESSVPIDVQLVAGVANNGAEAVRASLRIAASSDRIFELFLPPLRERREDIPLLAAYFLQEQRRIGRAQARAFANDAMHQLESYAWPGNLHELRATVEFASIQSLIARADEITRKHLPANLGDNSAPSGVANTLKSRDYRLHLARAEVALVAHSIDNSPTMTKTQLADTLGYSDRFAFSRRLRKALEEFPQVAEEFKVVATRFSARSPSD